MLMTVFSGNVNASLLLESSDLFITAEIANTATISPYFSDIATNFSAVSEPGSDSLLIFIPSGFEQAFRGNIQIDFFVDRITAVWSGAYSGVALLFNFTSLAFDVHCVITGISLVPESIILLA